MPCSSSSASAKCPNATEPSPPAPESPCSPLHGRSSTSSGSPNSSPASGDDFSHLPPAICIHFLFAGEAASVGLDARSRCRLASPGLSCSQSWSVAPLFIAVAGRCVASSTDSDTTVAAFWLGCKLRLALSQSPLSLILLSIEPCAWRSFDLLPSLSLSLPLPTALLSGGLLGDDCGEIGRLLVVALGFPTSVSLSLLLFGC
mmetsp:Transcript_95341/g.242276  ORF Transcript_95341/g.242276 Transcript_95341/m.242276 type:complete len:202 (+) Transcript_95341:155-760(+)